MLPQPTDVLLSVKTKYYTAELTLRVVKASEDPSTVCPAEGIVLVFDATRHESFEEVKRW
jgi:hypothetical protein